MMQLICRARLRSFFVIFFVMSVSRVCASDMTRAYQIARAYAVSDVALRRPVAKHPQQAASVVRVSLDSKSLRDQIVRVKSSPIPIPGSRPALVQSKSLPLESDAVDSDDDLPVVTGRYARSLKRSPSAEHLPDLVGRAHVEIAYATQHGIAQEEHAAYVNDDEKKTSLQMPKQKACSVPVRSSRNWLG